MKVDTCRSNLPGKQYVLFLDAETHDDFEILKRVEIKLKDDEDIIINVTRTATLGAYANLEIHV